MKPRTMTLSDLDKPAPPMRLLQRIREGGGRVAASLRQGTGAVTLQLAGLRLWIAGAAVLAAITLAAVAFYTAHAAYTSNPAPHAARLQTPALHVVRAANRAAVAPKAAPEPTVIIYKPSVYALEQQMSFAQLMKRWDPWIAAAAKRFDVPENWIRAVMRIESGGRTMLGENQKITSSTGAMGLMQLMPQTYNDMREQYRLGPDAYDPHDNILAGAAYLRFLRGKYGYPNMFAAYNDGPGNLEARMIDGGLLPAETINYVATITGKLDGGGAGSKGNLAKFTRPNGEAVMIDGGAVVGVRAALPGEYAPGVLTVISVGKTRQGVRESLAQAKTIIRLHGGAV
jgi:soluble lytic murein transglycosylase-like protein